MNTQVIIQGTLGPDGKLDFNQPVGLPPGPVEIVVRSLNPPKENTWIVLERLWAESRALGLQPRSVKEIDAELRALRDESEEEIREIEQFY